MQERLYHYAPQQPQLDTLVFAHANGYPPGCYRQLMEPLTALLNITGISHRALWDANARIEDFSWRNNAEDLIDAVTENFSQPVWLMGHSMGATAATFAAQTRPDLFKGLILLDPVYLPRRMALALRIAPRRLRQRLGIVKKALSRPDRWQSTEEAFAFHRGKRAFSRFSDSVLHDYITHGTQQHQQQYILRYSKYWEAHVYASVPWVWSAVKKISLPCLGMRGEESDVISPAMWRRWQAYQPNTCFVELDNCGHMFPLEVPERTAQEILRFLDVAKRSTKRES